MRRRPTGGRGPRARLVWAVTAAPLCLAYLATLSPTVPLEDGGEMIAPAVTLGINHPPGYPVYALIGRLASALPVGDPAFRLNLLSAGCGAAAAGTAAVIAAGLAESTPAGVVAGLALGWSTNVWWQSVIAEKYAMNLFLNSLIALALAAGLGWLARGPRARGLPRWAPWLMLAYGTSASHHGQTIYFAPAVALLLWWGRKRLPRAARARAAALLAVPFLLGLSVKFLYPPIRSAANPLFNWNAPATAPALAQYLSGSPYQYRILYWTPLEVARRFLAHVRLHPALQFGWVGVALAVAGLVRLIRRRPHAALLWGITWGAGTFYCVNFLLEGIAIETYYMPVYFIEALWIACGVAMVLEAAGGPRWRRIAVVAALAVWLGWLGWAHGRDVDRSRHYFAFDYSRALLRASPPGAILIAFADYDLFPLWYTHYILGIRPDVILVNSNLLAPDKQGHRQVRFIWPPGQRALASRMRDVEDLRQVDLQRPVMISVVYSLLEREWLLPRGPGFRFCREPEMVLRADVAAERRWAHRWMTFRGIFDRSVPKDPNTRTMLNYYPYGDYRRGFVLAQQGRHREALAQFRLALRWPDFYGSGPGATHAGIAQELIRLTGDRDAARRELEEAVRRSPYWAPGWRALGAAEAERGAWDGALRAFRKIVALDPTDAGAAVDLARVEAMARRAGASRP